MNEQKDLLSASYGLTALEYTEKTDGIVLYSLINKFCSSVPQGHILDIGCAGGRDMSIFENKGYEVTGLEITPELAEIARSKVSGNVLLEDIVDDDISVNNVDGIWSVGAYHHFPRNSIIQTTKKMNDLLKDGGSILVTTKIGVGEQIVPDARYGGVVKYWSFYQPDELKNIYLQAGFKNVEVHVDNNVWLTLTAQK